MEDLEIGRDVKVVWDGHESDFNFSSTLSECNIFVFKDIYSDLLFLSLLGRPHTEISLFHGDGIIGGSITLGRNLGSG